MFGFGSRKEIQDALPVMRRIVDLTIPNKPFPDEIRIDRRFNCSLPCVLTPLVKSTPELSDCLMGITQDISDRGISVITMETLSFEEYAISVWPTELEEPVHLSCLLANSRRFAHGFWSTGFAIYQLLNQASLRNSKALKAVSMQALRADQGAEVAATP
ncbi:MAG: hypothetical protein VXZ82_21105 [Planctomycetota bacterium]|nr:hypothetical protein [Planctomycetota bacterium]